MARLRKLPALRLGKHWRFRSTDLAASVDSAVQVDLPARRVAGDLMPATLSTLASRAPRYQEGSLSLVARAKGPDVWVYRWRELDGDDERVHRKRVIGDVNQFPTKSDAKREVDNLRCEVNAQHQRPGKMTVGEAWGHFQSNELYDPHMGRSETTISSTAISKRKVLGSVGLAPRVASQPDRDQAATRAARRARHDQGLAHLVRCRRGSGDERSRPADAPRPHSGCIHPATIMRPGRSQYGETPGPSALAVGSSVVIRVTLSRQSTLWLNCS